MAVQLRKGNAEDASAVGDICYRAFKAIAESHCFTPDLPSADPISGVGPVTVDPAVQNDGAGRALMQAVMRRSQERGFPGMRLVQAGYHTRSLALYSVGLYTQPEGVWLPSVTY